MQKSLVFQIEEIEEIEFLEDVALIRWRGGLINLGDFLLILLAEKYDKKLELIHKATRSLMQIFHLEKKNHSCNNKVSLPTKTETTASSIRPVIRTTLLISSHILSHTS